MKFAMIHKWVFEISYLQKNDYTQTQPST